MQHTGSVTITSFANDGFTKYGTATIQLPGKFKGKDIAFTPYLQGLEAKNPSAGERRFIYDCMTKLGMKATNIDKANAIITLRVDIGMCCLGGTTVSGALVPQEMVSPNSVTIGYIAIA